MYVCMYVCREFLNRKRVRTLFYLLQDIQLGGLGILHEHCQLDIEDNEVSVTPLAKNWVRTQ